MGADRICGLDREQTRVRIETRDKKIEHYYVQESVAIAPGFLLAALHMSWLATLTHTPSPMASSPAFWASRKMSRPFSWNPKEGGGGLGADRSSGNVVRLYKLLGWVWARLTRSQRR